ncbi:protein RUFY3 isoform X4 [Silurus asotus]|uniref:Protein RUFY3 isoform X4 n=1 Tax=Silurus asotus TaxID=30991 RepID=A0AAD5ABD3_SILAS|nr:protein RUFY3 isoform X4 [Silurus asotus]
MAAEQDTNPDHQNPDVAESFISSAELDRPSFQDNNGHFPKTPEEDTFTPTSVIYFKEALDSANVQFAKKISNPPGTVKYEFHIETTKKNKRIHLSPLAPSAHVTPTMLLSITAAILVNTHSVAANTTNPVSVSGGCAE